MTVLRIALAVGVAALLVGAARDRRPPAQAAGRVRRAGGCLVLRARPPVGVHGVRRGRLRGALGAAGDSATGSRFSRSARRRSGSRRSACGAVASETRQRHRAAEKGLPCPWVRPATSRPGRLLCRRLVVNGRVVGEAALPGRAHLSPQDAPAGLAPGWSASMRRRLRPRDRPGPKAGGAMRVRDARCAKPPLRCRQILQVHVQNATQNQGGRRVDANTARVRDVSRLKLSDVLFWILAGMSAVLLVVLAARSSSGVIPIDAASEPESAPAGLSSHGRHAADDAGRRPSTTSAGDHRRREPPNAAERRSSS